MRIGRNMRAVLEYVAHHPGCCKLDAACHITRAWGASPTKHGQYESIDRLIRLGLLDAERRGNRYVLTLTDAGKAELK
jgi:hypothetical protein